MRIERYVLVLGAIGSVIPLGAQEPGDNAATAYRQAFEKIQHPSFEEQEALLNLETGAPYDAAVIDRYLEAHRVPLELLSRGASCARCDFELSRELGPAMLLNHLPSARELARIQMAFAKRKEILGDRAGATRAYLLVLPLAVHLDMDRILISSLVAMSIADRGLEGVEGILAAGAPDADTVAAIARALDAVPDPLLDLPRAARGEGTTWADWLRQEKHWKGADIESIPEETREFLRSNMGKFGLTEQDLEASRQQSFWVDGARAVEDWFERLAREYASYPASIEAVKRLDAEAESTPGHPLVRVMGAAGASVAEAGARLTEKRRMIRLLTALADQQGDPSLERLANPVNSISGAPFRLRVERDRLLLESPAVPEIYGDIAPLVLRLARR